MESFLNKESGSNKSNAKYDYDSIATELIESKSEYKPLISQSEEQADKFEDEMNQSMNSSMFSEAGNTPNNLEDFASMSRKMREQPDFHLENQTLCMKIFPKVAQRTNLSQDELQTLHNIKYNFIRPVDSMKDQDNYEIRNLFMYLAKASKIKTVLVNEQDMQFTDEVSQIRIMDELKKVDYKTKTWKTFGFQNFDPRSDFRAAGYFGMKQLASFALHYPNEVYTAISPEAQTSSTESSSLWFFLALFSIKISHFLIVYFYLGSKEDRRKVVPELRKYKCKRFQFKNVIRLSNQAKINQTQTQQRMQVMQNVASFDDRSTMAKSPITGVNEIHAQAMIFLLQYWHQLWKHNDNKSAIEKSLLSARVFEQTYAFIIELSKIRMNDLQDVQEYADAVRQQIINKTDFTKDHNTQTNKK